MYSRQRSRVCGKLLLSSAAPLIVNGGSIGTLTQLLRNAQRDFFKHMPEDAGWQACKSQETVASGYSDAQKLILGSLGIPLDHLSVKWKNVNRCLYVLSLK